MNDGSSGYVVPSTLDGVSFENLDAERKTIQERGKGYVITLYLHRRPIITSLHQTAQKDGNIRDIALFKDWRVLVHPLASQTRVLIVFHRLGIHKTVCT